MTPTAGPLTAETLAEQFHEAYERLAPQFSYATRKESAVPWQQVPENNRNLMVAVCREVLASRATEPSDAGLREALAEAIECVGNHCDIPGTEWPDGTTLKEHYEKWRDALARATPAAQRTQANYMQRLPGGICFAHGPYTEMQCPKWPACATDPQNPDYVKAGMSQVAADVKTSTEPDWDVVAAKELWNKAKHLFGAKNPPAAVPETVDALRIQKAVDFIRVKSSRDSDSTTIMNYDLSYALNEIELSLRAALRGRDKSASGEGT